MRSFLLALTFLLAAGDLAAQERQCDYFSEGRTERTEFFGSIIIYLYDRFEVRCTDGTVLRANSGRLHQTRQELTLEGDVDYQDPGRTLTSDRAEYNSATGRLYASGNVFFRDRVQGSTIRGPELEYYSPMEGRPEAQVFARQRPHLTLQPREQTEDSEPLEIDADQVIIHGEDRLQATGSVVISRSDLDATAAEAEYDGADERLHLRGDARIVSGDYDLTGQSIRARMSEGAMEHVHARNDAGLAGEDLTVTAPDLQLFFTDDLLQRAVARVDRAAAESGAADDAQGGRRPGADQPADQTLRAVAVSRDFQLEADSIDAIVPAQRLERVVAVGSARGQSLSAAAEPIEQPVRPDTVAAEIDEPDAPADTAAGADTAAISIADRDWISGDTIIGYFAVPDTAEAVEGDTAVVLERIVAKGSARSLYRVEDQDGPPGGGRGINFLAGEVIELTFAAGELDLAEVTGLQRGVYLDPTPPERSRQNPPRREGG